MKHLKAIILCSLNVLLAINLNESFSSRRFPPLGWCVINNDGGAQTWGRDSTNYRSAPGATSSRYESFTLRNNDWLITPKLYCYENTPDTLKFWYKKTGGGNSESLEVWLSITSNDTDNFTILLWGKKFSNISYQQNKIPLDNFDGEDVYIAFVNKGLYGSRLCIDDISGPEMIEIKDVAIESIITPILYIMRPVGGGFIPRAIVKNYSNVTQYNFPVACSIFQGHSVIYSSDKIVDSLKVDSSMVVNFELFVPSSPGRCSIKISSGLIGDSNPTNDSKVQITVLISGRYTGGPDDGHYYWIDSDTTGGPIYNWYDISLDGSALPVGDAMIAGPIPIGFPFNFYGESQEEFWYSTNGFITFDEISLSYNTNNPIPNENFPNGILAPFWDNLYTYDARYKRLGVFPNRYLIVQWKAQTYRQGLFRDTVIFQLILHENGDIIYQYNYTSNQPIAKGESVTVGIESPLGNVGLSYLYNGTPQGNLLSSGRAIRFYRDCHDVSLDSILISEVAVNETILPTVLVRNRGTYEESFKVKFGIYDNQNMIYEDSADVYALLPTGIQNVSFRPWVCSQISTYTQKSWIILPSDINHQNDTCCQILDVTFSAPVLLHPRNGTVTNNNNIFFDWTSVNNCSRYNFVVNNLDTVVSFSQLGPLTLNEGSYNWRVRAGNQVKWGKWSPSYSFYIDRTPPQIPILVTPLDNCTLNTSRPVFIWRSQNEPLNYELLIYNLTDTIVAQISNDTFYSLNQGLTNGRYFWKLRAQDLAGNWSAYSSTFTFYIKVIYWHQNANILALPSNKPVGDGGAITAVGNKIYALKGNNTRDFYVYDISVGNWDILPEVPYSNEGVKKNVKVGGAIVSGENKIYLIKGNATKEFWAFDLATDSWNNKLPIPSFRNLRAGSALTYYDGVVYVLVGSDNRFEFYKYQINEDRWESLARAPSGPNNQLFRSGSCICYGGAGKIYALKGSKGNEFYVYDILTNEWMGRKNLPLVHPQIRKAKYVRAGGAITYDGNNFIYAIKGGRSNEFWRYDILNDSWYPLETIPRLNKTKSYLGGGASMTFAQGKIWLLKGNKTLEFWRYEGGEDKSNFGLNVDEPDIFLPVRWCSKIIQTEKVTLYGKSNSALRRLKIYNVNGQLIKEINAESRENANFSLPKGVYFIVAE
ncbi:MAG: choice-of-anchor J domain-containing protein [candidate division WOR-3 bacterium]|nr:choice-of-anchor J domain-containing protein [candidate division WOR-3 bacterium]MDW7987221.1 choice-of-anchor J domain-containing protein [candidate division WOR-3 bacterium]